jgi:hypothetical protein
MMHPLHLHRRAVRINETVTAAKAWLTECATPAFALVAHRPLA